MEAEDFLPPEVDIQKAVVESLAADKAEQDERIKELELEKNRLISQLAQLQAELKSTKDELARMGEALAANGENQLSNQLSLLDRPVELPDRFVGETRDHVLEVIKSAQEKADADGRLRLAQLLEGVLLANEPTGNLAKKRGELDKLFAENQNILSGPVIAELEKMNISYKKGEEYLLPAEIRQRTY